MNKKLILALAIGVTGVVAAFSGALAALECARTVDVVKAIAGGFGAGAAFAVVLLKRREGA